MTLVHRRLRNSRGASLVEYALLLALISLTAFPALSLLGIGARDTFDEAKDNMSGGGGSGGSGNGEGFGDRDPCWHSGQCGVDLPPDL